MRPRGPGPTPGRLATSFPLSAEDPAHLCHAVVLSIRSMRTPFDVFAKRLAESALSPSCSVETSDKVTSEVLEIDAWVQPDPAKSATRELAGLLGRMCAGPASLEAFHDPPTLLAIHDCNTRRNLKQAELRREAERTGGADPPWPDLWVIAAGRPATVIARWEFRPMHGWPAGCYGTVPGAQLRLVVVPELPHERDTLLVRLMGAGRSLREAWQDFDALADDAWERSVVLPVLEAVPLERLVGEARTIHDEEAAMTYQEMQQTYEENKRRLRAEGRAEGEARGRADTILDVLTARGIVVANDLRERVLSCRDTETLRAWTVRAATVAAAEELFDD